MPGYRSRCRRGTCDAREREFRGEVGGRRPRSAPRVLIWTLPNAPGPRPCPCRSRSASLGSSQQGNRTLGPSSSRVVPPPDQAHGWLPCTCWRGPAFLPVAPSDTRCSQGRPPKRGRLRGQVGCPRQWPARSTPTSGDGGTRTRDPLHAMQVRYQLRHTPRCRAPGAYPPASTVAARSRREAPPITTHGPCLPPGRRRYRGPASVS